MSSDWDGVCVCEYYACVYVRVHSFERMVCEGIVRVCVNVHVCGCLKEKRVRENFEKEFYLSNVLCTLSLSHFFSTRKKEKGKNIKFF